MLYGRCDGTERGRWRGIQAGKHETDVSAAVVEEAVSGVAAPSELAGGACTMKPLDNPQRRELCQTLSEQ